MSPEEVLSIYQQFPAFKAQILELLPSRLGAILESEIERGTKLPEGDCQRGLESASQKGIELASQLGYDLKSLFEKGPMTNGQAA